MTELDQIKLPARGNIRVFLPRRRVSELVWIFAQLKPELGREKFSNWSGRFFPQELTGLAATPSDPGAAG